MSSGAENSLAGQFAVLLLIGGVVALFACSRFLAGMVSGPPVGLGGPPRPGRRAVAFFIPIAITSLTAMLLGRVDIAVAIVFGTSVAALTTVAGYTVLGEPVARGSAPPRWRRLWPFPLLAALIVFVAGFRGSFDWRDALALITEGLVLITLWIDRGSDEAEETSDPAPAAADSAVPGSSLSEQIGQVLGYSTPPRGRPDAAGRAVVLSLEILLIAIVLAMGAYAATRGAVGATGRWNGLLSAGSVAATVVSLGLALPMSFGVWRRAAGGNAWEPLTTQVGVVLLNLCLLLPLLILIPYAAAHVPQVNRFAGEALIYHAGLPKPLVFPSVAWRIDTVVLIIAGAMLLPVSFNRWGLSREEGMLLIAGYFFYMITTLAVSMRV